MNTRTRACAHCAHVTAYYRHRIAELDRKRLARDRADFDEETAQIARDSL